MKNKKENYRIVETSNECYIIQKKIIKTEDFLFWKKEIIEWKRVDKNGTPYYYFRGITNKNEMIEYKTFHKAMCAINDFEKYPIIYELDKTEWKPISETKQ